MFRRLTAVLVISAGLLGLAHPALACSIDAFDTDCCSTGSRSPCDRGAVQPAVAMATTLCCLAGTTALSSISVDTARTSAAVTPDVSSPDPLAPPAGSLASRSSSVPRAMNRSMGVGCKGAALTYLRTGRLRL